MPPDVSPRRTSLVAPILLITLGALFLYWNWHPDFSPWYVLVTYWPLILIFIGLGKIWDHQRQRQNPTAPRHFSAGSTIGVIAFVIFLVLLIGHGHGFAHRHGSDSFARHQQRIIELQEAKSVDAAIEMSAGDLNIVGKSGHLLDARFDYRGSSETPKVDYNVDNGTGQLTISEEHSGTHMGGMSENNWNLRFASGVPLGLKIDMGAGSGNLRLRDIDITKLELNMGAGRVEVDLTGDRKKDLQADIEGGVGEAVIHLPKNVGVIVNASGGIGTVDANGLKHDGNEYTNAAYGKSPTTIHVKVQGGVGRIALIEER